jgi:hypothetical protein
VARIRESQRIRTYEVISLTDHAQALGIPNVDFSPFSLDFRSIGVSNFSLEQLQALVKIAKVKPVVNQVMGFLYLFSPANGEPAYPLVSNLLSRFF